jgi:cytolysin-activating lysine-acyltransferase
VSPLFGAVLDLTLSSPLHAKWAIEDCYRLFGPPLKLGQCVVLQEEGEIVAFATYAKLSEEASEAFTHSTRLLRPSDWTSGDKIWLVDCIAPWGHAKVVTKLLRQHLRSQGHEGEDIFYKRRYPDGRVKVSRSQI